MIRIYNSLKREKEEFKSLAEGQVKMYVCGPTVYDEPHIGHARSAYIFDVIRRYLQYRGYDVTFVRNVTDVDDKIINKAREEFKGEDLNSAVKKVSSKYFASYQRCMDELGIREPDAQPKATEYIDRMIEFIETLIEREVAYVADGDVYFDIKKAKDYGKLSNQSLENMESGARVAAGEKKRDPLDFALWKKAKEDEPSWDSPWGRGRPGWHIECSVMSSDILGDEFDIHGGGIDLIFPHHENELAQSQGAGKKFARHWIHNGLLTINGQKMAKSLGNFVTVDEVLSKYNSDVLKILYLGAHYSNPVDFSWKKMEDSKAAYERIDILLGKIKKLKKDKKEEALTEQFRKSFAEAMDDDFNTPKGLAVLFDIVNYCNSLLEGKDKGKNQKLMDALSIIEEITNIFGVTFEKDKGKLTDKEIENLIQKRLECRKNKDYKAADKIRQDLDKKGVILEDTKEGTTWRRKI
ncbi:MAG: cysteine--tRNA ligase [Candidatus Omnitrophota bacterium]|nr:MAG: cysteine--tRNA ligase [Candidatus Omnitrophota bacterium]